VVRQLSQEEQAGLRLNAEHYVALAARHREALGPGASTDAGA
jgi:carbonic anhydrase/acetyltransferase-like protein (isoleucine patch superfamily)